MMLKNYIAHACGGIQGITYTNSKEALDLSYANGHRFIEFDTNKTSDGKYVLIHDWEITRDKLFAKQGRPSYQEFKQDKMVSGHSQMDLDEILKWFVGHPDAFIVGDTKDVEPLEFVQYISENYPSLKDRVIPQIYHFSEYYDMFSFGVENIIFGTYRVTCSDDEIIEFLKKHDCYAVSMNREKAEKGFALKVKKALNLATIVFAVNDKNEEQKYKDLGIDYFFTDHLIP